VLHLQQYCQIPVVQVESGVDVYEFNWQMVVVPLGMSPEEKFVTQENQIWFKMNLIQKLLRTAIQVSLSCKCFHWLSSKPQSSAFGD
jgi:hypothetical protein